MDDGNMEESEHEYDTEQKVSRRIKLGICAMEKKVKSRPMHEILNRLSYFQYLDIIIFEEKVIAEKEVEDWPIVDCLICFYSNGFPLEKGIRYEKLRNPFVINNLEMQYSLMDRRIVHEILDKHGIPQPKYAVLNRDESKGRQSRLVEHTDHIEVDGVVFHKPFVEKPISADDHNIYIYYPSSAGGGSQRLFRKEMKMIGSRSSVYSPVSKVRTSGCYIYEEFMPTDGTDVKVYTVGTDYAHAEARKAPALDGKVERDVNGKEIRYPVILSAKEKMIARTICNAFQQNICGFDLLRANGVSYVCDVNGFSFVKTSSKYYDDCATVLGSMILKQLAPQLSMFIPAELAGLEQPPIVPTTCGTMMELRCVIAVIRHADRTPKQKMKMEVKHTRFFELFAKYGGQKFGQLKLKQPAQLQEVLDIVRESLEQIEGHTAPKHMEENKNKFIQLKTVLEMYGHFSGINRKIQLKYQNNASQASSSSTDEEKDPILILILKWGGELTDAGKKQAEDLGKAFRCIYPKYGETPGLGLLRLHSTYRHDLKIYASDEGRVQMTAAAFAKGFLALEGRLTPILVQMVKSGASTNGLLDTADDALPMQKNAKETLQQVLNTDAVLSEEEFELINPCHGVAIDLTRDIIANPFSTLHQVYNGVNALMQRIKTLKKDPHSFDNPLYHQESLELMFRRWWKLEKDFRLKDGQYDVCKIPDIYDNIKYDLQHNRAVLDIEDAEQFYHLTKAVADVVVPQEFGLSKAEKLSVGASIAKPLLRKIKADLLTNAHESEEYTRLDSRFSMGVITPDRHVRTRLYFTSESHIHSLVSLLNFGSLADESDEQWNRAREYISNVSELNYLSQVVIMMYEDPHKDRNDEERFHIELHFSPGVYDLQLTKLDQPIDSSHVSRGYRPHTNCEQISPTPSEALMEDQSQALGKNGMAQNKNLLTLVNPYKPSKGAQMNPSSVGPSLISTKVILGSHSAPNLRRLSASKAQHVNYGPAVPEIMPLETLHNSLTLKQFDEFLNDVIKLSTTSPRYSSSNVLSGTDSLVAAMGQSHGITKSLTSESIQYYGILDQQLGGCDSNTKMTQTSSTAITGSDNF